MLGVLLLVPGVLFLGPRSVLDVGAPGIGVPGVASSWALLAPRYCWFVGVAGSWHYWLLGALGALGILGNRGLFASLWLGVLRGVSLEGLCG